MHQLYPNHLPAPFNVLSGRVSWTMMGNWLVRKSTAQAKTKMQLSRRSWSYYVKERCTILDQKEIICTLFPLKVQARTLRQVFLHRRLKKKCRNLPANCLHQACGQRRQNSKHRGQQLADHRRRIKHLFQVLIRLTVVRLP